MVGNFHHEVKPFPCAIPCGKKAMRCCQIQCSKGIAFSSKRLVKKSLAQCIGTGTNKLQNQLAL